MVEGITFTSIPSCVFTATPFSAGTLRMVVPKAEHSVHIPTGAGDELIHHSHHDVRSNKRYSITIIEEVAFALGVDPMETPLHLDEYQCSDATDRALGDPEATGENCKIINFPYGDYSIFACSCGKIAIYGDLDAHVTAEPEDRVPCPKDDDGDGSPGHGHGDGLGGAVQSIAAPLVGSPTAVAVADVAVTGLSSGLITL